MAQAISNTTNPYNPASLVSGLLKPIPYSGLKLKTQTSTPQGITSGPNQNMSPYTGGGLAQKPTAPKPVASTPAPTPAPAPVAPTALYNANSPYTAPGTSAGQPINQTIPPPQTGNVSTPSGAVVNSSTGSLVTPPPTSGFRGLFPDVVSSLANRGTYTNPMIEESYRRAQGIAENLRQSRQNQATAEAQQRLAPIPLGDATGRQAITRQQYETQQSALSQQLAAEAALAGIGQGVQTAQQSALGSAAGFAQPQVTGYGQTTFNPLTGTFGGGAGGAFDPQQQALQLAQEVANGTRTYGDAISALGYAGSAGATFLNNALRQVAPNFNFSQAQALGTVQGQVAPQLQMAQSALNNLQTTFANTPWFQKTGFPLINTLTNMAAQIGGELAGLGTETAKQNAIKEARTQVANALGVMTNTTPTAWTNTVESWFPDNATPDQVQAGIEQFTNLAANRQQIYGAPGQVTPFGTGGGSTSGFDW